MAKLSSIKPRLGGLTHRIGAAPKDEAQRTRQRDASDAYRAWYKTARWQKLRQQVLVRDAYTCRRCRTIAAGKGQAVADHIKPHRGSETLFWDAKNLQCLCKPCHDRAKQAEERSEIKGVWY